MLAPAARPSRPGDPGRFPGPGPGPHDLRLQPRYGVGRADTLARAGGPVLRPPLPSRDAQPRRLDPGRGPLPRSEQAAADGHLAGGLARRTARLEAARPAGQSAYLVGKLVPRGIPR